jgi:hypothetical protein
MKNDIWISAVRRLSATWSLIRQNTEGALGLSSLAAIRSGVWQGIIKSEKVNSRERDDKSRTIS